jgi:hypothetical protein
MRTAVETELTTGGRTVCSCHGWQVRRLVRRTGETVYVHCEHPSNYIFYGEESIPDYCEKCGWNLGRSDEREQVRYDGLTYEEWVRWDRPTPYEEVVIGESPVFYWPLREGTVEFSGRFTDPEV